MTRPSSSGRRNRGAATHTAPCRRSVPAPPRLPGRRWPCRDYFWELAPADDGIHPIEALMGRSTEIRKLTRRVLNFRRHIAALVEGESDWIRYVDAKVDLEVARQELAFNLGVEVGAAPARAEQFPRRRPARRETIEEQEFRVATRKLLLTTSAPASTRAAILLDLASALLAEMPTASTVLARRARSSRSTGGHRPRQGAARSR